MTFFFRDILVDLNYISKHLFFNWLSFIDLSKEKREKKYENVEKWVFELKHLIWDLLTIYIFWAVRSQSIWEKESQVSWKITSSKQLKKEIVCRKRISYSKWRINCLPTRFRNFKRQLTLIHFKWQKKAETLSRKKDRFPSLSKFWRERKANSPTYQPPIMKSSISSPLFK